LSQVVTNQNWTWFNDLTWFNDTAWFLLPFFSRKLEPAQHRTQRTNLKVLQKLKTKKHKSQKWFGKNFWKKSKKRKKWIRSEKNHRCTFRKKADIRYLNVTHKNEKYYTYYLHKNVLFIFQLKRETVRSKHKMVS
jgi:hypothetical protein